MRIEPGSIPVSARKRESSSVLLAMNPSATIANSRAASGRPSRSMFLHPDRRLSVIGGLCLHVRRVLGQAKPDTRAPPVVNKIPKLCRNYRLYERRFDG